MDENAEKHLDLFADECRHWIEVLGLTEWECQFGIAELPDGCTSGACVNTEGRLVEFALAPVLPEHFGDKEVAQCAFHEVVEGLLLDNLSTLTRSIYTEEHIEPHRHAVVRRLENAWWRPDWDRRMAAEESS